MAGRQRVVIVGGGFGGLEAARRLRSAPVDVTLIDRRNFHLFQPLLYQVATGGLSPANIAAPLRGVLARQPNARVVLGEVTGFDLAGRRALLRDGAEPYDTLIVATGARHHYFGHPEWEALAPGLKTLEDATTIRARVLLAFEHAERTTDPEVQAAWLTFVIIGAGPTGVELAGAIGELAHMTLRHNFRRIDPSRARILLVEGLDRVLPPFPPKLSARAQRDLQRLGVTVKLRSRVIDLAPDAVTLRDEAGTQKVATHTVFWAAGVQGSPLGKALAQAAGAETDPAGRVKVGPDLSLPGQPEIFVLGDLAHAAAPGQPPLPGVATVAIQQARYVADLLQRRLAGRAAPPPFRYHDPGKLATIGRNAAVADLGWWQSTGFVAWLLWLFVHLINIVTFESRLLVMLQWGWNYLTRGRSARLITWDPHAAPQETAKPDEKLAGERRKG